MNKIEFKECTELLVANYSKTLNIQILSIWYEELKNYSKEDYSNAVKKIIKNENFMPSLAKVKEYMKKPSWINEDIEIEPASEEEIKKLEERLKGR